MELDKPIAKAAATVANLNKRADNSQLTLCTKLNVFQISVLSTLLYDIETWTTYIRQEKTLGKLRSPLPMTYPGHHMARQNYQRCCARAS